MTGHYRWLALIVLVTLVAVWMVLPNPGIHIDANGDGDYLDTDLGDINKDIEIRLGLDLQGGIRVLLTADVPPEDLLAEDMEGALGVIENRVNALGVTEPMIQLSGSNRIIVELPGISDPQTAVATIRETGLLEFVDFQYSPPPIGTIISTDCREPGGACGIASVAESAPDEAAPSDEGATGEAATGQELPAEPTPAGPTYHTVMTGRLLGDAYPIPPDRQVGLLNWSVGMTFKPEGRAVFADYTRTHVNQYLGIVLDGEVISAPTISEVIDSDSSMIRGDFTYEEARALAIQLRYGALPVPLRVESIQAIGPTLGAVSVDQSIRAGVIGVLVVLVFMLVYYRVPGVAADLALVIFVLINLALFKFIPVTLTLPAITGFLISVGTAVDGNILIFERMKEELRDGRNVQAAVRVGFDRAWTAIRDSNFSTILICVVLYFFGSQFGASAVRGFAVTLAMGLLINLFTAVIVTRTFLAILINLGGKAVETRRWLLGV
ncbi:MAG: protein translocase subunit SecD [Anaerolineae bacterium]